MIKIIQYTLIILSKFTSINTARYIFNRIRADLAKKADELPVIYVDKSVISKNDAKTGIQRVVRGVTNKLFELYDNKKIKIICATRGSEYKEINIPGNGRIIAKNGDIFLGLDLSAHILPNQYIQLARMKQSGMIIAIIVYDLIPENKPYWFNKKTVNNYKKWLRTATKIADVFITLSEAVKLDLERWLEINNINPNKPIIKCIPLAGDMELSNPTTGLPPNSTEVLKKIKSRKNVLVVGTIEPRKGHSQALKAFERLWNKGSKINLVIAGKPGWKTTALQEKIARHSNNGDLLFWFSECSDEWLSILYKTADLVLIPSLDEGLGLPLIEAMQMKKRILARDLPSFREIGEDHITYFSCKDSKNLADKICALICEDRSAVHYKINNKYTWENSVQSLLCYLRNFKVR